MKKLFTQKAIALAFLFVPYMAQSQWQIQTTLDGRPTVQVLQALDENIVWLSTGQGYTYRTTDGGQNWRKSTFVTSDEFLFVMAATDSLTAVVGGRNLFENFGNEKLYRTTDGGQSWNVVYSDTSSVLFWNMIHFFDAQNGIAMSDPPNASGPFLIVKTTDGGATWTPISNPPSPISGGAGIINAFQFYDEMNGWFGTAGRGYIFRTTDGGETWTGYASGNTDGDIWSIDFVSPTTGVRSCDSTPFLTRTTDGGQTWMPVTDLPVSDAMPNQAGAVASIPGHNQIWIGGDSTSVSTPFIITSADSGQSWQKQTLPDLGRESIGTLTAAVFGDDSVRVWAATVNRTTYDSGGQILTYTGPLASVTAVEERPIANISDFRLEQNYPNPFNPTTNIEFSIPKSEFVTLKVYNILGEEVATLVSERLSAGKYKYDWDASSLASGVYLYRIQAGDYVETRKMVLIK